MTSELIEVIITCKKGVARIRLANSTSKFVGKNGTVVAKLSQTGLIKEFKNTGNTRFSHDDLIAQATAFAEEHGYSVVPNPQTKRKR